MALPGASKTASEGHKNGVDGLAHTCDGLLNPSNQECAKADLDLGVAHSIDLQTTSATRANLGGGCAIMQSAVSCNCMSHTIPKSPVGRHPVAGARRLCRRQQQKSRRLTVNARLGDQGARAWQQIALLCQAHQRACLRRLHSLCAGEKDDKKFLTAEEEPDE